MNACDITDSTLAGLRAAVGGLPTRAIIGLQGRVGPDDVLAEVRLAGVALDAAHDGLDQAVGYARQRGHSWAAIGTVLGITRQGAEQRFGQH